jgi:hypothetical protein
MSDTLAAEVAELRAELDAYRNGAHQLAWDPHTAKSPHLFAYDHAQEPVVHVQHTYDGVPAWSCSTCLRVTLVSDDEADICRGCGADDLAPLWFDVPCDDEERQ